MPTELDTLLARSGLIVPPDRGAALQAAFLDLQAALALLAAAEAEPAHVFRPDPLGGA